MWNCLTVAVLLLAADGETSGHSPYQDWPDQGMRTSVDVPSAYLDLFPTQAAAINSAYGGQPWRPDAQARAGQSNCERRHTAPSNSGRYVGYSVGGGHAGRGSGPSPDEGMFGWDYAGFFGAKRIALDWSHRRYQGGTGAYATDGARQNPRR